MLHWLYWLYWLFLNAGPVAILNWDFRLSAAGLRPSGPNNFARRRLLDAQAGVQPSPFLRRFPPWLPLPTPPPPKPPRNRQNVPDDGRVPLLHHSLVMNAARNQFSLTRVASKPAAWRKSKFLSVLPDLGTISTLARQGTADTLLQVGSDTNADPGSSLLEPDS